ncbi:hypothetical protein [Paenibacillus alkalitolerans]|uniref:hypothetical protein n=1 Tax=Paenibacillus alkalitolerans TaxID=2799335 RepID=UPI0018F31EF0|nr:hypothetical protein [Paenibacillus alkalitolerans]
MSRQRKQKKEYVECVDYLVSRKKTFAKEKQKVIQQYYEEDESLVTESLVNGKPFTVRVVGELSEVAKENFNKSMQKEFIENFYSKLPKIEDEELLNRLYLWFVAKFWSGEVNEEMQQQLDEDLKEYYLRKHGREKNGE